MPAVTDGSAINTYSSTTKAANGYYGELHRQLAAFFMPAEANEP